MAKYVSRYAELGFYVNNELRKFTNGEYTTEDAAEIAVLSVLPDAQRIEEEKPEESAPKAPTSRKGGASGK